MDAYSQCEFVNLTRKGPFRVLKVLLVVAIILHHMSQLEHSPWEWVHRAVQALKFRLQKSVLLLHVTLLDVGWARDIQWMWKVHKHIFSAWPQVLHRVSLNPLMNFVSLIEKVKICLWNWKAASHVPAISYYRNMSIDWRMKRKTTTLKMY